MIIDHRDLRVQHAAVILLDDDAGLEQLAVERACREVKQQIFDSRLQQQCHHHAASSRILQRPPETDARKKVRIGDDDLVFRCPNRGEVRALDVPPMTKVVAGDKFRGLRADALAAPAVRKQRDVAVAGAYQLHERPHPLHSLCDRHHERPFDHDREVGARRRMAGGVGVIDDVDAADERHATVDLTQLAVQAPEAMRAKLPWRDLGTIP